MKFQKLLIDSWKQFSNIDIDFHPRLTILTGANGSGKTTILNLLSQHFGWGFQELATPAKDKQTGIIKYFTRHFWKDFLEGDTAKIGELVYDNGSKATLKIPDSDSPNYTINVEGKQAVPGLYILSHRPVFNYRAIPHILVKKRTKKEAFDLVVSSIREKTLGGGGGHPSNYHIKETLLTWSIYGFGNTKIEADQEQIDSYNEFEEVLRKVLPKQLGFKEFTIRNSEVVLKTSSGEFMIDAVSGGVSSLIDLAWQIYMFSTKKAEEFVVLIDEMENHLHATMQRAVLPDLLDTFPNVQFIVSTHNPLIVGSVEDSNVYALQFNEKSKVESQALDLINRAKTASEILQEVLGVPFTMPIWVENKLKEITNKYSKTEIDETSLKKLRHELSELGLEDLMPQAITDVLESKQDD